MFIEALDVDDVIAHLLVTEGFSAIEEVAFVPVEDLVDIEGFDEGIAEELRVRARTYLEQQEAVLTERSKELGLDDDMQGLPGVVPAMLVALGEQDIKTRDDLADLAGDELIELLQGASYKEVPTATQADEIIMAARAHWFEDEEAAPEAAEEEVAAEDGGEAEA